MAKIRQDAWSHENDLLLAETVLRHIREGSTQLNAFEEVGDVLNRTAAACGFRWNAEVRTKYHRAIELAKRQRKERKRAQKRNTKKETYPSESAYFNEIASFNNQAESTLNMDAVIHFLKDFQMNHDTSYQLKYEADKLKRENKSLKYQISALESKLEETKSNLNTVESDYKTFIEIMERARKMTVLSEEKTTDSPTFKMDKNGNLEQIINEATN